MNEEAKMGKKKTQSAFLINFYSNSLEEKVEETTNPCLMAKGTQVTLKMNK